MKMNKQATIAILLAITIILMANMVSAFTLLSREEFASATMMKNTTIEYTSYREIVVNDPGVIYLIKITNTGKENKTYEIAPNASAIMNIGTYRIDPSDTATLEPDGKATFYLYLAIEKAVGGRTVIPVKIKSGSTDTTIELVARPVGPFMPGKQATGAITRAFKIVLSILLIIIIILALLLGFRRIRKKGTEKDDEEGEKPDFGEDVETYY